MRYTSTALALLSTLPSAFSVPAPLAAPEPTPASSLAERQLLSGLLKGVIGNVQSAVARKDPAAVNSALLKVTPTSRPRSIQEAQGQASKVWAAPSGRSDVYVAIASQVAGGLAPLLDGTLNTIVKGGIPAGENNVNNDNPPPPETIYPKKENGDAPYSISEDKLRKALYIPEGFTYGDKRPVLMVPGTGSYGGTNFANNLRKLLQGSDYADPVWLNVPGAMVDDTQNNSEYIAYAINYLSAISESNKDNLAVITWSQGGLDTQWVLKYWPSTRKVVKDFMPVSADFKGTVLANALCLSPNSNIGLIPCPPSVIQQQATSDFVRAMRRGGGSSAYVPTTTFFSGFLDEIVQPMSGPGASGYMNDERGVGVSNNEVNAVCAGRLGGGFYGHAGVLAHPLTYALIVDALTNDGPGSLARINVRRVCGNIIAPGLDLDDYLATMALIPVVGVTLLAYPDKRMREPALRAYAR
ncbi:hypothetical protein BDU57DRAFT_516856 [Ampelomyces quisqualis]|uniref:Lipase B n=1 Tax=Ampelomyces quisqualis TaxID=50730 RepID=A0A6A5QLJ2_AMPQU|nr:hypothetical protein BDU57DRAFT_516856 [Ampelomyces quisqualis]